MNQIDKMFKNKLGHYSVDVPEGAWENIVSRLPEPKRSKKPWPGFMASLLVLFISSILGYTILFSTNENTSIQDKTNPTVIAALNQYNDNATISTKNDLSFKSNQLISGQENNFITKYNINKSEVKPNLYNAASNQITKHTDFDNNALDIVQVEKIEQSRLFDNVSPLSNKLEKNRLKSFKKIKFSSSYTKEKVKACPFVTDTQDKSVDVYISHDYANRSLVAKSQGLESYATMRNSTEKSTYSYSIGARLGYNLSYRWNLHTGFNFTQINEKFQYVDPESNQTKLITTIEYFYNNGKIIDSTFTEEFVTVPGTTKLKINNKYRLFDIPVIGRYTLMANKHLSLSAMGGVYINIGVTEKGMILDKDSSTPIDIAANDDNGNSIIKTQMGITGFTGISLAYHLTSNIDFLLEPNARFQFESMTTEKYPINQQYTILGLSTGLRYKF